MKIRLEKSPVEFSEHPHGYHLGGKRLSGITSLIRQVLGLGVYPDASEFVRNYAIPRAGEYGTAVHHAIEDWDNMGIRVTLHPKSERFRKDPLDTHWDVTAELETYIRHKAGFTAVANEYTVSDNARYASQIDNVWLNDESGEIWLVDTKTNNLDYYPHGLEGLREYLSWQLSIYAYLFERQNPGLKASRLACNWLRHEDGMFIGIERKPDEKVEALLSVPWAHTDNGYVYDGTAVQDLLAETREVVAAPKKEVLASEMVNAIDTLLAQKAEIDEKIEKLRAAARLAMEKAGVKTWDAGPFKVTLSASGNRSKFDSKSFKKDHPDLYAEYTAESWQDGALTIKRKQQ